MKKMRNLPIIVGQEPLKLIAEINETVHQPTRLGFMAGQATIPDDFNSWLKEEAVALGMTSEQNDK